MPEATQRWSGNNEDYEYLELGDLLSDLDDVFVGQVVYVGDLVVPKSDEFFNVEQVIEDMQEKAWDLVGEVSDGFLDDVSDSAKKELSDSLINWLDKYGKPRFGRICNEEPYIVTKEDIDDCL